MSFPSENEAVKHNLVEFMVQFLKVFCCHGNKSTILPFKLIFRTTPEVSSKLYFVEKSQRSYGFLITKELIFWLPNLGIFFSFQPLQNLQSHWTPLKEILKSICWKCLGELIVLRIFIKIID